MNQDSTSLNKYISMTGICSRREADKWIEAGRVKINGEVAQKGNRVFAGDQVTIDEKPLKKHTDKVYIALHKPPGITSTTDQRDHGSVPLLPVSRVLQARPINETEITSLILSIIQSAFFQLDASIKLLPA